MDSVWLTGDPAGMRELAGRLRGLASAIGSVQDAAAADVAAMTFEAPAAERIRASVRGLGARATDVATQPGELAGTLESAATQVEQAQAEEARRLQELANEARLAKLERLA